jgi:hypothetical protein
MRVTVEVSEENESTRAPWWMIINPRQSMRTGRDACHAIAGMITGPFFSRAEAQAHLDAKQYNYGPGAVVYCHSGHASGAYCRQIEEGEKRRRAEKQAKGAE